MNTNFKCVASCCFVLASMGVANANLLANGDFSDPGLGASASFTGLYPGPCAATDFEVFHNFLGTTRTDIRTPAAGLPSGSPTSLFFYSNVENSEIDQSFLLPGQGSSAKASVWVYLLRGGVGMGIGNGGSTGLDDYTTTTGQWIELNATHIGPTNNFIVGTYATDGAEFYVANAKVSNVPGPVAFAPFAIGLISLRRRAQRKAA